MKKLLLGALCIVVMSAAGFGGYTYYENQKQEQMDPWLKANLAALADLENPTDSENATNSKLTIHSTEGYCYVYINGKEYRGGGKPICQKGKDMTRCPDCYVSPIYN